MFDPLFVSGSMGILGAEAVSLHTHAFPCFLTPVLTALVVRVSNSGAGGLKYC